MFRLINALAIVAVVTQLAGCGGNGSETLPEEGGGPPATAKQVLNLTLTNPTTGAPVTSITSTSPARVTASVTNEKGVGIANVIVVFTSSDSRDTFAGSVAAILTGTDGTGSVLLTTSNVNGGASTLTASAKVGDVSLTASLNYAVSASTLGLGALSLPAAPISAYGTATVGVDVLNNGALYAQPMTVSFSSTCATLGKATITPSVTTVNGRATAKYQDNGCNNAAPGDLITATLVGGVTSSGNLAVNSPALGSIQFVAVETTPPVSPAMITLKGTGGAGMSETAKVRFRVVDSAGKPLGNAAVSFALNTSLGGLSLSNATSTSDPVTGEVSTYIQAGTVSTVVRVTATTGSLSTQSDQLVVSTGIPAQDSFSLSASVHNIEGWGFDGVESVITARLADHFHNPVPNGTAVYFTAEGGSIGPSCTTVDGVCSVKFRSQALRPDNGRVTVLATAIGEEAFIDKNGNGVVDAEAEMRDANDRKTDIGEAYLDYNENGRYDSTSEPYFVDFNSNGLYDGQTGALVVGGTTAGDGKYNGRLCQAGAEICSNQRSINVRGSEVIVLSTSVANIVINNGINPIQLPPCTIGFSPGPGPGAPVSIKVVITDQHGNAMPKGSKVSFETTNGKLTSEDFAIPDTTGCRTGFTGCPQLAGSATFGEYYLSMQSDGVFTAASGATPASCANATPSGVLTVRVETPSGMVTSQSVAVTD